MDTSNLEKNPIWYVYGAYTAAGQPKAEDCTMSYARKTYMFSIIPDYMLRHVVKDIQSHCDKLLQENKRLKPVYIRLGVGYDDNHKNILIGSQSLHLTKVNKVIE